MEWLMSEQMAACIFCRSNDMADECWHSPEYEYVARALAQAFQATDAPTDEQVSWYVDEAEEVAADLRRLLGKDTPLVARQLGWVETNPDTHAVIVNERMVVTFESSNDGSGEVAGRVVADLTPPPAPTEDVGGAGVGAEGVVGRG